MKKIMSILIPVLIVAMAAGVSGCVGPKTSDNVVTTQKKVENTSSVVTADIDEYDLEQAFSLKSKDERIMFCTMNADDMENSVYLVLMDASDGKVTSKTKISDLELADGCEFGENNTIIVTDTQNNKCAKYDMNMKLLEVSDYSVPDYSLKAEESPYFSNSTDICDTHSTYTSQIGERFTYFYDDLNTVYLQKRKDKYDVAYYQKTVISKVDNTSKANVIDYYVDDYANSLTLSKQQIKFSDNYSVSDYGACIGNEYAFVIVFASDEKNDDFRHKGYIWNYTDEKPVKNNDITKYSLQGIKDYNNEIINSLSDKYNVNIKVNEPNSSISDGVQCDDNYNEIELTDILTSIQDFLNRLPEGMVSEIYGNYDYLKTEYPGIRIDIVSQINTENTGAFAESLGDEMQICFGLNDFEYRYVPHEFMHLIDIRIEDYLKEENLLDYWTNETGQDYKNDDKSDTDMFITEYAATNDLEDRAEIFAFLFTNSDDSEMPSELKSDGIAKKSKLLCKLIRDSYPSVQNSNSVCWEKYIES